MKQIEIMGIVSFPAITVICFLFGLLVKASYLDDKWIPIVCGFVGGCLGVIAAITVPEFIAHDPISAIAVGIVSGLASTGAHQVWKQLTEGGGNE